MKYKTLFLAMLFLLIINMSWASPVKAQIMKHVAFGLFLDAPSQAEADRYYLRTHGPEIVFKSGPWMRRYVAYLAHTPPDEATERFGAVAGRYCELWWGSVEEYHQRQPTAAITLPSWESTAGGPRYTLHVPAVATEVFYDPLPNPEETSIIRWVQVIRYPDGVSMEEGERWFLEIHAKEALQQPGLLKFISFSSMDDQLDPEKMGTGIKSAKSMTPSKPWVRVNEYWYKNFDDWRKAVIESPPNYTAPPWGGEYPFVEMGSTFIDYKWDVDFLKGDYVIP